jgi:hypothetical protein
MAGSVDKIPRRPPACRLDTGSAPELAMKSEAKAKTSADHDRRAFEPKAATAETQGKTDSRGLMREDHTRPGRLQRG